MDFSPNIDCFYNFHILFVVSIIDRGNHGRLLAVILVTLFLLTTTGFMQFIFKKIFLINIFKGVIILLFSVPCPLEGQYSILAAGLSTEISTIKFIHLNYV